MRKLFTLCLLVFSLSASAQWQQTGSKVRYVNGLGIPTRDTAAGVAADSSQILIRPADSSLYVKYKRTWLRVGGGGGSIAGSGTTNYIPKFTSSTAIGNSQIFDNGTNVGVGETSPNGKLDVRSATGHVGINTGTSLSPERGNLYYSTDGTGWKFNIGKLQSGTFTPQMTFQDNGNVGIGTPIPVGRLHLLGAGTEMRVESNTTTDGFIRYINTSGSMSFGMSGAPTNTMLLYDRTNNHNAYEYLGGASGRHVWYTANAERMRITSGGDLQVSGSMNVSTLATTNNLSVTTNATVGGNARVSGTLIAGTTADNGIDKLQVYGTSYYTGNMQQRITSPKFLLDDSDNTGTASIWFRPQSASFAIRGSIELISTGSAAPTRFVIASTDTMTFRTNNVERMRITSAGGNVLISTTTDNNTDKLQVNGSIQGTGFNQAYTARTTTYTAATSDYFIDCTSGTFTVNLFTAVGNTGRILIIKNSGTGTITVDPNGTQTIDGATTQTLSTQWSRVHIISDGANWKIISN